MRGRGWGQRAFYGLVLILPLVACRASQLGRYEFSEPHMGTLFRIVLYAPDRTTAEVAASAAFERIVALERRLSDYDQEGELNRLAVRSDVGAPTPFMPVSPELGGVLALAGRVAHESDGAFDVSVGVLTRLWRRAARQQELPAPERLAEALERVGVRFLELAPSGDAVRLLRPGMRLDLGGIAKGYALDEALRTLATHGIERALVDGGGDVAVGAAPPQAAGWRIEVPAVHGGGRERILLKEAALATSGDSPRTFELEGRHYGHILDPRTGWPVSDPPTVSVYASSGMLADAWASALCVLGAEAGLVRARSLAGIEARFVPRDAPGDLRTPGFPRKLSSNEATTLDPKRTRLP